MGIVYRKVKVGEEVADFLGLFDSDLPEFVIDYLVSKLDAFSIHVEFLAECVECTEKTDKGIIGGGDPKKEEELEKELEGNTPGGDKTMIYDPDKQPCCCKISNAKAKGNRSETMNLSGTVDDFKISGGGLTRMSVKEYEISARLQKCPEECKDEVDYFDVTLSIVDNLEIKFEVTEQKKYSLPSLKEFMDSLVMNNTMDFGPQAGNVPVKKTKAANGKTQYEFVYKDESDGDAYCKFRLACRCDEQGKIVKIPLVSKSGKTVTEDGKVGIMDGAKDSAHVAGGEGHFVELDLLNIELAAKDQNWNSDNKCEFAMDTDRSSARHDQEGSFDDMGNWSGSIPDRPIDFFLDTDPDHSFKITIKGDAGGLAGYSGFGEFPVTIGCNEKKIFTVTLYMYRGAPGGFANVDFTFKAESTCR